MGGAFCRFLIIAITRGGKYIMQQLVAALHMRITHTAKMQQERPEAGASVFCRHAACRANRGIFLDMDPQGPKGQKKVPGIN
jgi:hypothetical protein